MRCLSFRVLAFLGLWLAISGFSTSDLAIGLAVAIFAAWVSVRLLPCAGIRLNLRACVEMALRLPFQVAVAGIDIARRALHPDLPLRPGFIEYTSHLPDGVSRSVFTVLVSMQPGAVPIADRPKRRFHDSLPRRYAPGRRRARSRRGATIKGFWIGRRAWLISSSSRRRSSSQ